MKHPVGRVLGLVGFGALASQAGHLIAYQIQFGQAAWTIQSQAAHAYFPALAKTGLGLAAGVLLGGLLIVGASRLAAGRPVRTATSPPLMPLVSILFTVQVTVFIGQETIESAVAGVAPHGVVSLLFLGGLGQLPVAVVAAFAIKWLAARFELAFISLRVELARRPIISLAEPSPAARPRPLVPFALAVVSPASFVKRGPPRNLLQ